jgi:hypothetical protein
MKKQTILLLLFAILTIVSTITLQAMSAKTGPDQLLFKALIDDDLDEFKELLLAGANPNTILGKGRWVMCSATERGKFQYLKLAVEYGGDINLRNHQSPSGSSAPVLCAIIHRHDDAFDYLAKQGADLQIDACLLCDEDSKSNPLLTASALNNYKLVYALFTQYEIELDERSVNSLISDIENGGIDLKSEASEWRLKVAALLKEQGYPVKPWVGSDKCRRPSCKKTQ